MRKPFKQYGAAAAALGALLAMAAPADAAVVFNFTYTAGTSAQAQAAFVAAGNRWSSIFSDNVTLNMTVGTASLGSGVIGQASSVLLQGSYATIRNAMIADVTTAADASAVASLSAGSAFGMLINHNSDNPNGSGSATPYVDTTGANTTTVVLTSANAKALGFSVPAATTGACAAACDASIEFSNTLPFDFDPSDGISAGAYDFVGVATHEIGHALGFISGVDFTDGFNVSSDSMRSTTLDLFRYSALSDASGVIDMTTDAREKYFSIDGGATALANFSTGSFGDGNQTSHWQDGLGLGIMDPTASKGELLSISTYDKTALDVIGWNLTPTAVPEPASWAMMLSGFAITGFALRRRKSALAAA